MGRALTWTCLDNIKIIDSCFEMELKFVAVVLSSLLRFTLGEEDDIIYWEDDPYGDPNRKRKYDPEWDAYVKAMGGFKEAPEESQPSQDVFLQSVNTQGQNQNLQGQWGQQPANMQFQKGQVQSNNTKVQF
jgi:hypothetical protein